MKRIIVCCDGTWNADDTQTNDTNVALLARAIYGSQQTDVLQIVLYLRGVGTTGLKLETWIEGTTGIGVDDNIRSAYQFIGQNYVPGDEIYLFGFLAGPSSVRSLAGLITAYGILFRQSLNGLPDAWIYYRSPKPHSPPAFAAEYQLQCHLDSPITFLGVWDTVGSLGIPGSLLAAGNKEKFAFHDTNPSPLVKRAVQALAIDEHRHDFTPTFWTGPIPPNARPRPPADEENDPNMLNSKIYTRRRPHHHATSQYDKTRKALDRLSGGFEVTSVTQAAKYDES